MATYNNYREHVYYLYKKICIIFTRTMYSLIIVRNMYTNYKGHVK